MSYQIAIDRLHLRPTPRLGHTEYCSNPALYDYAYEEKRAQPPPNNECNRREDAFAELFCMDFVWCTNDGLIHLGQKGRSTDMGHGQFVPNAADQHEAKACPFKTVEEVYALDAVAEYGLPDFEAQVAAYESFHQGFRKIVPDALIPGGFYNTLVSGAIAAFGWDMLLEAAADQDRFEAVLDTFFQRTLFHVKAWAATSIEVFLQHDDMVWTAGPFMSPAFYRRVIFPRYAALWKVLRDAGKKVFFCSDGDYTPFLGDIAAAGADGFIFEPITSLEAAVAQFGATHAIISSKVDCRTLTLGSREQIQAEVDATLRLAKRCPGFFCAVGNHIPYNVPLENGLFYLNYLMENWRTE